MGMQKTEEGKRKARANLIPKPINERPIEEQLKIRRAGQAAQQETLRQRRTIKAILDELLAMDCPESALQGDEIQEAVKDMAKERGKPLSMYEAVTIAQVAKAIQNGDTGAAAFVRDSAGDKPKDEVKQETTITAGDLELLRKIGAENLAKLKDGEK